MKNKITISALTLAIAITGLGFVNSVSAEETRTNTRFRDNLENFKKTRTELNDKVAELRKTTKENTNLKFDANVLELRKKALTNSADLMIVHAQNMIEKINKSETISDSDKTSLVASLNTRITTLEGIKTSVSTATTYEQLKPLLTQLQELRKDEIKIKARGAIVLGMVGRFEKTVVEKTKKTSERITKALDELNSKGKDTTTLRTELADANKKIDSIVIRLTALSNKVKGNMGDNDLKAIKEELSSVHNEIKSVYESFRDIVSKAKAL